MASVIRGSGESTLGGALDVQGVLTYEDVTSVDAVGIITANAGIDISNTIVSNNDSTIRYDDTDFVINVDPNNVRGSSKFKINVDTVNAITIDDNRRVGIGSDIPTAALDVLSTAYPTVEITRDHDINYPRLRIVNAATDGADLDGIGDGTGGFRISCVAAGVSTERLRIDSTGLIANNGRVPSNYGSPNLLISGTDSTLTLMGDGSTNNTSFTGIKFRVAGDSAGDYTKAGIFVQRQDSYNDLDMLFCFRSSNDAVGVDTTDSKIRINSDGKLMVGGNNDFVRGDLQIVTGGGGELNIGRSDTTVSQYNDIGHIFFSGNAQSASHAVASIACYAAEDHYSNIKPTYLTFTTSGRATDPPSPSEKLRIGPDGMLSQYGGQTNNSGGNGIVAGGYHLISVSDSIEASGSRTYTFAGLQSGWMSIRGGGYSSSGQSQFSILHHLGGYMTATNTYNVSELVNWGSGVTISTTKNASNYTIQLTNNSASYTLGVHFSIEASNSTAKVSANT